MQRHGSWMWIFACYMLFWFTLGFGWVALTADSFGPLFLAIICGTAMCYTYRRFDSPKPGRERPKPGHRRYA